MDADGIDDDDDDDDADSDDDAHNDGHDDRRYLLPHYSQRLANYSPVKQRRRSCRRGSTSCKYDDDHDDEYDEYEYDDDDDEYDDDAI